jgi:hypothetical protein
MQSVAAEKRTHPNSARRCFESLGSRNGPGLRFCGCAFRTNAGFCDLIGWGCPILKVSTKNVDRQGTVDQTRARGRPRWLDPARDRLIETRKSLVTAWMKAAEVLDAQGEIILAGDVRYFVKHLSPVLTDRQRLAAQFIGFVQKQCGTEQDGPERGRPADPELTR